MSEAVLTEKQVVLEAVQTLPEDATIEQILTEIEALALIRRGLDDLDAGRTISHAEIRARLAGWLAS